MAHKNNLVAPGVVVVTASATQINYHGLQVITASDLTFKDGKGQTVTLTAVPAGTQIPAEITVVSVCSGVVLGYQPN